MNNNEKDVSADQQEPVIQEMATQNEDESSPDKTTITSSLQAGINYCQNMADQMMEEIRSLQEKYDSTRQTNRVLKQNLVDLENEKQRLIADFQEDFRKFDSLNSSYVYFNFCMVDECDCFVENISFFKSVWKDWKMKFYV